ncbi:carboxypeptidase-like regulatory domain-containing protein [Myroides injenensis]|uniref:carboxypeptidase-like regulatory domain-containing protein n=1 Tax=Myroides injenensis TaxID=1183151 RepID=UPI000288F387|nr:carboxypeptidase-like regulatory domain-containing protein [Myroides injenensis]
MRVSFLKYQLVFYTFLTAVISYGQENKSVSEKYNIEIKIVDDLGESIPYSTIFFKDLNISTTTNNQGKLTINLSKGNYQVVISSLGFLESELEFNVKQQSDYIFILNRQSVELDGFTIMAKYDKKGGNKAVITQSALTYIQPTSIVDALVLLPGSLYQENSLNQFSGVNFRQSGKDKNSALGVSIVSDGISLNNDGSRNQLYGITGNSTPSFGKERNLVFNSGLDMRTLSTDHIESINIIRGISSAKYGNLSSGQINLIAKQGVSPLEIRGKVDPNVQLLYVGKGIKLPKNGGILHLGMDILSAKPDVREQLTKYTRFTTQANHNISFLLFEKDIEMNTKINYTQTLDNYKSDQSTEYNDEIYKVNYNKVDLTWKLSSLIESKWLDKIELLTHFDYTIDKLDRSLMVYSDGGINMSNAIEEGIHEALYLPSKYKTEYQLENKPFNIFTQLNFNKFLRYSDNLYHSIVSGAEFNSTKNYGKGAIINPELPPFPHDNTFIRPRANYDIPALIHTAYFLESDLGMDLPIIASKINFITGIRAIQLYNLPRTYYLNNKFLVEPRIQLNLLSYYGNENKVSSNFRIGYGQQNKLPTLDYLYPDKMYRDVEVLNWYDNKPQNRLLLTNTYIHDVENNQLKANKNDKIEVGLDFSINNFDISFTVFKEKSNRGYEYHYSYLPVNYLKFTEPKTNIIGKPNREDFYSSEEYSFIVLPQVKNSSAITKKGVEYRIVFPTIESINTTIEVNGAYYETIYTSNQPKMFYPNALAENKQYPFVGIYDNARGVTTSRLNSNLWINTKIPSLKLVFTTFIQALWYSTTQLDENESFLPSGYLDNKGIIHEIDYLANISNRLDLLPLDLRSQKNNFSKDKTKPDYTINIKGTKEFKNFCSLSFFVNNIVSLNAKYKNNFNVNQRNWSSPYFGVEVSLKLDKL